MRSLDGKTIAPLPDWLYDDVERRANAAGVPLAAAIAAVLAGQAPTFAARGPIGLEDRVVHLDLPASIADAVERAEDSSDDIYSVARALLGQGFAPPAPAIAEPDQPN